MSDEGPGSSMYREDILEHYKNPERFGALDPCTFEHEGVNPLCGDTITIRVLLNDADRIETARFEGQGCAISQASTDIILSAIEGEPLDNVLAMDEASILDLLEIDVSPLRVKCAVLPLVTIQDGAQIHRGEMDPDHRTRTDT